MDLKAAHARALAELEQAEAQYRAAQERVRKLEAARDGLEVAIEMYDSGEASDHLSVSTEPDEPSADSAGAHGCLFDQDRDRKASLRRLPGIPDPPAVDGKPTQVEIAFAAVDESGKAITTNGVRDRLSAAGYVLKYDQVRGALSWLEKQDRILRVGPGVWALPTVAAKSPVINGHGVVRSR